MRWVPLALASLLWASLVLAQTTLDQAHDAFRQGQWRKAARLFEKAAEEARDPGARAEIWVKLAWTYFSALKNRAKAEQALRRAFQEAPDLEIIPDLYTDDFVAAVARVRSQLQETVRTRPSPSPTPTVGSLARLRSRLATAVDALTLEGLLAEVKALESAEPPASLPDLLEVKADILDRLGRASESLRLRARAQTLRIAAQAAPGTPILPLELIRQGRQYLVAKQPQEAIALLQGILDALPSCTPAFEVLAQAYMDAGLFEEAYSALQTAIMSNEKPELLLALGELELARRRLPAARDAFRRAVALDPVNDRALAAAGLLAASMEDYASAKDFLEQALKNNGTLFEARVIRAQLAILEGQTQEAILHLLRALQVRPGDPWAEGWLGVAYLAANDVNAAGERLARATSQQKDFALFLAEVYLRQNQHALALPLISAESQDPQAQLLRAKAMLQAGQTREAESLLQRLVKLYPADGAIRYLLGFGQFKLGQWEQAASSLRAGQGLPGAPSFIAEAVTAAENALQAQKLMDAALTPPPPPQRR